MIYVSFMTRNGPVVFGVLCELRANGKWYVRDAAPYAQWSVIGVRRGMLARTAWDHLADFLRSRRYGRTVADPVLRWVP